MRVRCPDNQSQAQIYVLLFYFSGNPDFFLDGGLVNEIKIAEVVEKNILS